MRSIEQTKAYQQEYRKSHIERFKLYRERHKSRYPSYWKDYYAANRERRREESRKYASEHIEANRQRARLWGRSNREQVNKRVLEWKRDHPEQAALHSRRDHLNRVGSGRIGIDLIRQLVTINLKEFGAMKCAYCKKEIKEGLNTWHIDHICPISRGGMSILSNLAISCVSCNESKHNKDVEVWIWNRTSKELRFI